jgi:hypothetical protein
LLDSKQDLTHIPFEELHLEEEKVKGSIRALRGINKKSQVDYSSDAELIVYEGEYEDDYRKRSEWKERQPRYLFNLEAE